MMITKWKMATPVFNLVCLAMAWPAAAQTSPIVIDGRFDDWKNVRAFTDPAGDTHETDHKEQANRPAVIDHPDADLVEYKVAHDARNLYCYFRSRGQIARTWQAGNNKPAGRFYVIVAIDVDDNDET